MYIIYCGGWVNLLSIIMYLLYCVVYLLLTLPLPINRARQKRIRYYIIIPITTK